MKALPCGVSPLISSLSKAENVTSHKRVAQNVRRIVRAISEVVEAKISLSVSFMTLNPAIDTNRF